MRSVGSRIVAVTLAVALGAVLATAWVTNRETTREVRDAVVADEVDRDEIYEVLSFFAFTAGSWDGVEPVVSVLAKEYGTRIALTDISGATIFDSDPDGALPPAPEGFIDPANPAISFDEPFEVPVPLELFADLASIRDEAEGLAKALDEAGIPYRLVDDEFGIAFPVWEESEKADDVVEAFYRTLFEAEGVSDQELAFLGAEAKALADYLEARGIEAALEKDGLGIPFVVWDESNDRANAAVDAFYDSGILAVVLDGFFDFGSAEPALLFLGYPAEAVDVPAPVGGRLLLVVALVGVVAVLAAVVAARRLAAPIVSLTSAARAMGDGDLDRRVEARGGDELADLARTFNAMADSIQQQDRLRRTMTGDVAHELRTPLSNIRGYLEAIQEGVAQPSPEVVASLHEEALLLQRLVDDLQQLSLAEAGALTVERARHDVSAVASTVVDAHRARAEVAHIDLVLEVSHPVPGEVDPARLRQVVAILVDNALRHTPEGGRVTVTVDDGPEIRIADTGEGIAPEHLEHVFDRFYRADPSRSRRTGGSGLGLAIAREVVHLHGGTITVESVLGSGTTFTIRLPGSV